MRDSQKITQNNLVLETQERDTDIRVIFSGKSDDREPGLYLNPFFNDLILQAQGSGKPIVLDLSRLDYLNSSTITPLVQLLDRTRDHKVVITLLYDGSRSWQELCFSALTIFESDLVHIRSSS